ncbi:hypothetical protein HMPREF0262_01490 [Clostridium sp. ATCC 29733]|nr:hypothetical protein HMPREF0262_01490 [Clostridium sp. ATCC 29733]
MTPAPPPSHERGANGANKGGGPFSTEERARPLLPPVGRL